MATPIKSIPTLTKSAAARFVKNADLAYENRGTVDFTKQFQDMKKILEKGNMKCH
jgi:hypothetical protein